MAQIRNFAGLEFDGTLPTDIDGFIEYKNKGYIMIETKHGNSVMPLGQRLALERACDDLARTKPTILILTSHNSGNGEIYLANTTVTDLRWHGSWHKRNELAKDCIAKFISYLNRKRT